MTLDRLCVSTWAFHTQFENGEIRLLDFPEMIADRYGVHNLEIVAPHDGIFVLKRTWRGEQPKLTS